MHSEIGSDEIHLYRSDNHVSDFLDCVQSRRQPVAPVEVAHRSITLAHLGNIALRLGRELRWDPELEDFVKDSEASAMRSRPYRGQWAKEWESQLAQIPPKTG